MDTLPQGTKTVFFNGVTGDDRRLELQYADTHVVERMGDTEYWLYPLASLPADEVQAHRGRMASLRENGWYQQ